jgi:predicted PurR-regulated permease PerM
MSANENPTPEKNYMKQAVEIAVRLGLLAALLGWCLTILSPFIPLLIWGVIIAVATFPLFRTLSKKLGNRTGLTASLLVTLFLVVILIPCVLLADSLLEGVRHLREVYNENGHLIPPPPESVNAWPSFTKPLIDIWRLASNSIQAFVLEYKEQLGDVAKYIFRSLAGVGLGILEFVISVIIAGVMLAYAKSGGEAVERIFIRLIGNRGREFVGLTETTIRQVVKGILGVAVIQTVLASLGFFIAGVPLAGLWAVICLVLAIIQVGVGPVVIPIIIYMWSTSDALTAGLFTGWSIFVLVIDNVLKPLLLGKGAPVPMLVIFLGAIGGFIATGFVGLFLGAVILSLTYKLAQEWMTLQEDQNTSAAPK